jgi:hypothetical protein
MENEERKGDRQAGEGGKSGREKRGAAGRQCKDPHGILKYEARKARSEQPEREPGRGHPYQVGLKDGQNWRDSTDSKNRTGSTGKKQAEHDIRTMIARTGQPGSDSRARLPGQDYQGRIARTG